MTSREAKLKAEFDDRMIRFRGEDCLPLLASINRGVERETLRVTPEGKLALSPHPAHLGSKLCHPCITTDFCESQLELITPVARDVTTMLDYLDEVHRFVYTGLGDEALWSASMPCRLPTDGEIPLAYYGPSNLGRLKTTYRNGLGYRYGRTMQTICAIHYNFSLPDELWNILWQETGQGESLQIFRSRRYFELMRNFRRFSWLPVYLFGASPAVGDSFVRNRSHKLQRLDDETLYAARATSLRNGNLGYQSDIQANAISICYNSLDNYVDTLVDAILTPYEPYTRIGAKQGDVYRQLSTSLLQAEAEFYTTIRAKCIPPPGRNFLKELSSGGVVYLEVRLLDLNPYLPLGIDEAEVRFLDTLLLYSLLLDSPEHGDALCQSVQENVHAVVYRGRDPGLLLNDQGRERTIRDWGLSLLQAMQPVAELLDRATGSGSHCESLGQQMAHVRNPESTLSARMLADMQTEKLSFVEFALARTLAHRKYFERRPLPEASMAAFRRLAVQSRDSQAQLEVSDKMDFDDYLASKLKDYRDLADA